MKYLLAGTLLLSLMISCKNSDSTSRITEFDDIYYVDVVSAIEDNVELKISDIASGIRYIPLETTPTYEISQIRKVQFTENFIFVSDKDALYQFAVDGSFIQQIGSSGRGPGEYLSIMNFGVNEKAKFVLVVGEYSTVAYDLEGNYIKTFKRPPGVVFEFLDQDRIVFYRNNNVDRPVNLVITNQDLKPVKEFYNYNPKPATNFGLLAAPLYSYKNHVYFKEYWNDTLFCIQDSVLVPHIIVNEKNLLLDKTFKLKPSSSVTDLVSQLDKVEDKLLTHSIYESDSFIFLSYHRGMNPRDPKVVKFIFDKMNNATICIKDGKIINDIDGGMDLYPNLIVNSGILIQWVDAYRLKKYLTSDDFVISVPEYPSRKKELEKLSSNLKDTDNPVLMLIKLKE